MATTIIRRLARFALCISGGTRTLEYTAQRYIDLILAQPQGDVDIFAVIGSDSREVSSRNLTTLPKSARDFLQRPEVKALSVDTTSWEDMRRKLSLRCLNPTKNRMESTLMQAQKIKECQKLVDAYVSTNRRGEDYSLVIRTRPDLLLPPEPLSLVRVLAASVLALQKEPKKSKILFVPMCCDWNGLNDQFAIGTADAMRDYSQRLETWRSEKACSGDSDAHTLANARAHDHDTVLLRFHFEYGLLREKLVPMFVQAQRSFREQRKIVSAGSNGYKTVVNLGTICSTDPSSVTNLKLLQRQKRASGQLKWTIEALACQLDQTDMSYAQVNSTSVPQQSQKKQRHGKKIMRTHRETQPRRALAIDYTERNNKWIG
jgi:hypothetical protein